MLLTSVAIVLLLAANAFFVAAEFAIVKVRGIRIEALAEQGSLVARLTLRILANVEAYLSACQLGITMASLGLGWIGEPAVAALLEPLFRTLGLSEAALHTIAFLLGFLLVLLAPHRGRRAGAEDARDPQARADVAVGRLPAARVLPDLLPAQLGCSTGPRAGSSACSRSPRSATTTCSPARSCAT